MSQVITGLQEILGSFNTGYAKEVAINATGDVSFTTGGEGLSSEFKTIYLGKLTEMFEDGGSGASIGFGVTEYPPT